MGKAFLNMGEKLILNPQNLEILYYCIEMGGRNWRMWHTQPPPTKRPCLKQGRKQGLTLEVVLGPLHLYGGKCTLTCKHTNLQTYTHLHINDINKLKWNLGQNALNKEKKDILFKTSVKLQNTRRESYREIQNRIVKYQRKY